MSKALRPFAALPCQVPDGLWIRPCAMGSTRLKDLTKDTHREFALTLEIRAWATHSSSCSWQVKWNVKGRSRHISIPYEWHLQSVQQLQFKDTQLCIQATFSDLSLLSRFHEVCVCVYWTSGCRVAGLQAQVSWSGLFFCRWRAIYLRRVQLAQPLRWAAIRQGHFCWETLDLFHKDFVESQSWKYHSAFMGSSAQKTQNSFDCVIAVAKKLRF